MSESERTYALPASGPGGSPQLGCDLPLDLRPVMAHNELLIGGWAWSSNDDIVAVEVELAGRVTLASYGHPSPFLASAFDHSDHCRFELRLDTSALSRGTHELRIRARAADGAVAELTGTVQAEPFLRAPWELSAQRAAVASGEPAMWCEVPNIFGGITVLPPLTIRGWAHAGSGIESVTAFIAGIPFDGVVGLPRLELDAAVGGPVGLSGGFRIEVAGDRVPMGRHEVVVIARPFEGAPVGVAGSLDFGLPLGGWMPREIDADGSAPPVRYDPDRDHGTSIEIEHRVRYWWASMLAEGRDVLDAGCGTGWGAEMMARAGARSVIGIDRAPGAIERGRATSGEFVDLRIGDVCLLELEDESFDLVVCFDTLEQLAEPWAALDHFRRVLRPDGVLIVSTAVTGVYPDGNPFHRNEFEAGEVEAALERRFDNVRADRQRSQAVTILADDRTLAARVADRPLDVEIAKLDGVVPGDELFTVLCASDGALPPSPRLALVGDALDFRAVEEHMRDVHEEFDESEARRLFYEMHLHLLWGRVERQTQELDGLRAALNEVQAGRAVSEQQRLAIESSKSWRWTEPLRGAAARGRSYPARKKP